MSKPLPNSSTLGKFCHVFDAYAETSNRKFFKQVRQDMIDFEDPNVHYNVEEVAAVAIHIPTHRLEEFLNVVDEQKYKELAIRDQVPAVKLAYERYKMLLKMCGGDFAGY